jgi:hypothetical protein
MDTMSYLKGENDKMKNSVKKTKVALAASLVLAVLLLQVPTVYSIEHTAPEKALAFITDVIKLDITKYNVTLSYDITEFPGDLGGLAEENIKYALENDGSKLNVIFKLVNGTLANVNLSVLKGSPVYADVRPANIVDETKSILQRLPNYSTTSHLQQMNTMLNSISDIKNDTIHSGNSKLITSVANDGAYDTSISLVYSANGVDYRNKAVIFEFKNGNLRFFANTWDIYKIGSDALNVTEKKAISIAMDAVPKNYSYQVTFWNGTVGNITGLNVVDDPIRTELQIGKSREHLTLYPYWIVHLYYDQVYPSNLYGWTIYIWSDTGEVFKVSPKLFMGDIPSESNPQATAQTYDSSSSATSSSEPTLTQPMPTHQPEELLPQQPQVTPAPIVPKIEQNPEPVTMYAIGVAVIIIPIVAIALGLKKRSK